MRNLTLSGKILIIKTFALSHLMFIAGVLHIPDNIIKDIEEIVYEFLWSGKTHKVKKNVIIQEFDKGGYIMVNLLQMVNMPKLKIIRKINISEEDKPWFSTMKKIFK